MKFEPLQLVRLTPETAALGHGAYAQVEAVSPAETNQYLVRLASSRGDTIRLHENQIACALSAPLNRRIYA